MVSPVERVVGAEPSPKDQAVTNVELPAFLAPMLIGNRLEQYAYITVALTPANREKMLAIREKMPFLRDAFLREVPSSRKPSGFQLNLSAYLSWSDLIPVFTGTPPPRASS